ncbi:MAG: polysulfide reductase NrfD [Anaerolineae bacterium]|jgi:Fe-S-cluster-containing dehydrogenase component/formate-dependent nitrite reductase membrane component NrfD|nr:polysulfide reductase NrfD [Anaerolineae bacterium]
MTNYGFIIDNRKCIGCHACTTACKQENEVPLGVNRTWVKSVETGAYPNTRRHFQVTRCNHCANPPCVRICPVSAMYQRADGIVEFDPQACIGCKACLQACPYDAIYIDPEDGTAAKCHYCAHRTEIGLEPACVVVCPEHAIIAGDMDDPASEISRMLARESVTVRKPEQGTAPKLFYIDGNDVAMHPTAVERTPATFAFAQVIPLEGIPVLDAPMPSTLPHISESDPAAKPSRPPQPQGQPSGGPIHFANGRMADHMTQVTYNQQHKVPWHWPVPTYLVTKGIGAGAFMLLALGDGLGLFPFDRLAYIAVGFVALLFTAITTGLLVYDLERPERFLKIIFRPQWRSWLTRGAFILMGFSAVVGIWWLVEVLTLLGAPLEGLAGFIRPLALGSGLILGAGTAVYTAFLFGQAEGRDLWQSSALPFHLLTQAFAAGSAGFLAAGFFVPFSAQMTTVGRVAFVISAALALIIQLISEYATPHSSDAAIKASHEISHGRYLWHFWGSILIGHLLPMAAAWLMNTDPFGGVIVLACTAVGLYLYEYAFVMAPQEIPNS